MRTVLYIVGGVAAGLTTIGLVLFAGTRASCFAGFTNGCAADPHFLFMMIATVGAVAGGIGGLLWSHNRAQAAKQNWRADYPYDF
jgi:hypothetical protein